MRHAQLWALTAAVVAALAVAPTAFGQAAQWVGHGEPDDATANKGNDNWSWAPNWLSGVAPTSGTDLEVEFYFVAISMDNTSEDFWVQYYDGSTWHTVAALARGTDFDNGVFYNVVVQIPAGTYNYPTNAKLRFMCDASGNRDDVYIDEIEFRGYGVGGAGADMQADLESAAPERFALAQNYPNPFNPTTTISFNLAEASHVRLEVYNVAGQRVATLINESRGIGPHSVSFDAGHLSSGIYIYRLTAGSMVEQKKMVLLK